VKDRLLAAFDLDGTLLKKNSSFAFCRYLLKERFFSRSDFIFCMYAYMRHCYFGFSLWELHQLVFERFFRGKTIATFQPFLVRFLNTKFDDLLYQPALLRLKSFQKQEMECILLSSSPYFLVHAIAQKIGIEKVFATEYEVDKRGELISITSLMDGMQKEKIVRKMHLKTIAFSDSHLDLPFLESAYRAVVVNPKRTLKKIAKKRGWEIL